MPIINEGRRIINILLINWANSPSNLTVKSLNIQNYRRRRLSRPPNSVSICHIYNLPSRVRQGERPVRIGTRTGSGRAVPDPPQLLQTIFPEPAQERHPTSPSDHREHRHVTRPVPLHVSHRGHPPAIGRPLSIADFTIAAPTRTPSPVASWETSTRGPIVTSEEEAGVWWNARMTMGATQDGTIFMARTSRSVRVRGGVQEHVGVHEWVS